MYSLRGGLLSAGRRGFILWPLRALPRRHLRRKRGRDRVHELRRGRRVGSGGDGLRPRRPTQPAPHNQTQRRLGETKERP